MRAGHIDVSKEIISGPHWKDILKELKGYMTILYEEEVGHGIVRMHGESPSFDDLPEGATRKYDAIFTTDNDLRQPKLMQFRKI